MSRLVQILRLQKQQETVRKETKKTTKNRQQRPEDSSRRRVFAQDKVDPRSHRRAVKSESGKIPQDVMSAESRTTEEEKRTTVAFSPGSNFSKETKNIWMKKSPNLLRRKDLTTKKKKTFPETFLTKADKETHGGGGGGAHEKTFFFFWVSFRLLQFSVGRRHLLVRWNITCCYLFSFNSRRKLWSWYILVDNLWRRQRRGEVRRTLNNQSQR